MKHLYHLGHLQNSGIDYYNLLPAGRKDSKFGTAWGMIKTDFKLIKFLLKFKPDVLIGTSFTSWSNE
jgi:hypothetical protein